LQITQFKITKGGSTAIKSVLAPYSAVQGIYEYFAKIFEPPGLNLNFDLIKKNNESLKGTFLMAEIEYYRAGLQKKNGYFK
jgi:hypothetical protein